MTKMKEEPGAGHLFAEIRTVPRACGERRNRASQSQQTRQAKIATAKASLQEARSLLIEATGRGTEFGHAAQKKANADVKESRAATGAKRRSCVSRRHDLASEGAIRRAQRRNREAEGGAVSAVEDAKRAAGVSQRKNSREIIVGRPRQSEVEWLPSI